MVLTAWTVNAADAAVRPAHWRAVKWDWAARLVPDGEADPPLPLSLSRKKREVSEAVKAAVVFPEIPRTALGAVATAAAPAAWQYSGAMERPCDPG